MPLFKIHVLSDHHPQERPSEYDEELIVEKLVLEPFNDEGATQAQHA